MNRNIIISLFVVALATSCSGRHMLETAPATIGFAALADEVATKALVTNSEALRGDNKVGVYGRLTYGDRAAKVYEGEKLKYDGEYWRAYGSDSFISKYWTEGCNYNFGLISPYSAAGTAASNATIGSGAANFDYTTGNYTINCTSVSKDSPDLLVGIASRNIPTTGATDSDFAAVDVTLKHAFAAVEFRVKNSSGKTVTDISNIQLTGLQTAGTLAVPATTGIPAWSSLSKPAGTADNYKVTDNILGSGGFAYGTDEAKLVFGGPVVVIPQLVEVGNSAEHIKFSFRYKRTGDPDFMSIGEPYDLSSSEIASAYKFSNWEPGKKYTYTATITTDAIIFHVEVKDWRDGGSYILK